MICREKERLAADYDAAINRFGAAVADLNRKMGTSVRAEYARLQRVADEEQVKSEQARFTIQQHVAAHDC